MGVHRRMGNGGTNPNRSQDTTNSSEDVLCGGGFHCFPVRNTGSVANLGHAYLRCHFTSLMQGVPVEWWAAVESDWHKWLGGRFTRGLQALVYIGAEKR